MSKAPTDEKIVLHAIQYEDRITVVHDGGFTRPQRFSPVAAGKTTPQVPTWTDPGLRWAWWGDNDLLPTTMRQKIELVPIAGATLERKVSMMIGEDLQWVKTEDYRRFGVEAEPVYNPEVEDWMEANRIETEWFPAQCADYCLSFNAFSEIVLSPDRKKANGPYHISAEHARLSKANAANQVNWLLYSYPFPYGTAQADTNRVAIPLYKWYDRERFMDCVNPFRYLSVSSS